MKKGFTLIEVLVTVIILAVLAAVALPRFVKTRTKITQRQAESYLRAIRISQKMYYARYGTYACTGTCSDAAAIRTPLGTEIKDGNYTFSLTASATTFTATAAGPNTITLNQDGAFTSGGSAYTPP